MTGTQTFAGSRTSSSGTHTCRKERERDRVGSARARHDAGDAEVGGELPLEGGDLLAEDEPAPQQDPGECAVDRLPALPVVGVERAERDAERGRRGGVPQGTGVSATPPSG
jgi:hypothetical protein